MARTYQMNKCESWKEKEVKDIVDRRIEVTVRFKSYF